MADNSHRDKQFHKPTHDVENPSVPINNIPSASHVESSRSISKTMKLGIVLLALSVAVVLGVTLSAWSLRDGGTTKESVPASAIAPSNPMSESSIKNESSNEADNTPTAQNAKGAKPEPVYYTSDGPIESRVKMISPSIVNGYESCSDLESDITEVLKLYMNNFIKSEAVSGEKYANCDPENDDWMWGLYGYSDYFYYGE
jgi:DNA excision repair protein ERCC-4